MRGAEFTIAGLRALATAAVVFARPAHADDAPVPDFARYKPRVADADTKAEGNFVSGLPLIGFDPSTELGLGVGGYYTMDGKKKDSLFAVTPYRHRIFAQIYLTTGGYQNYMLSYDGVYIANSPYRIRATAMFERNTAANYFGTGERTLLPLFYKGHEYDRFDDFAAATPAHYSTYEYDKPSGSVTLERDFWGGRLRALYGLNVSYAAITPYDATPTAPTTLLGAYCAYGRILGCPGGWDNQLKAGVALDTRDFEPDPTRGVFIDAAGEWSTKAIGSSFDYLRFTVTARGYFRPIPKLDNVVVALRALYSMETSGTPFWTMNTLALTEGDQGGLGGERTIRGYRQDRFVGNVAAVANAEVRWTFVHFRLLKQLFSLQIAPVFDVGRIFDNVVANETFTQGWKWSAGAGLRIGWNRSTIIMFDAAASTEDIGFYIDFGMPY